MLFQPKGMRMSSESERSSPLPDPAEIARRAERQRSLYEEAAENPDRVVPAMFIEDCARCETLADKRRREGFYKHFYRTLPDRETAELSSDDLPEEIQSAAPVHLAIDDTTLEDESADVASVSELWEQIGTGEHPGKLCQTPLVHYIDREDCYIHAEPTRVGFSYGLPVFVYKNAGNRTTTTESSSPVRRRICGSVGGFFTQTDSSTKEFIPSLYFLKASNPSTVAPRAGVQNRRSRVS